MNSEQSKNQSSEVQEKTMREIVLEEMQRFKQEYFLSNPQTYLNKIDTWMIAFYGNFISSIAYGRKSLEKEEEIVRKQGRYLNNKNLHDTPHFSEKMRQMTPA